MLNLSYGKLSQIKSVAINTVVIELVSQLKCNYINSGMVVALKKSLYSLVARVFQGTL